MAVRLGATVGYLIGDSEETDPIYVETHASFMRWINSSEVDAKIAWSVRAEWRQEYGMNRSELTTASFRKSFTALTEVDWDQRYQRRLKKAGTNGTQNLFG